MSAHEHRTQAKAWARVARAAAASHASSGADGGANRELFDAVEYAATQARLDLPDLVDAYAAGAPQLDISEASDAVQDYLDRVADVQALGLSTALAQAQHALPDWRRRLELRIAAHDLVLAWHRALGGQEDRIEQTRTAIVEILNGARAADASDDEIDAFIRDLRIEHCDLTSAIAAATWIAAERQRLAAQRGASLPGPAWATTSEIASDRGVPQAIAERLVNDALRRGLLTTLAGRGLVVTAAGHQHTRRAATR